MAAQLASFVLFFFSGVYTARFLGPAGFGILSFAIGFTALFAFLPDLGLSVLTVRQVARDTKPLIDKARRKALLPDEYIGGSLTISNIGVFGIDAVLPIINPPESAIVGVGGIKPKVVARDGGIHIRNMMLLTLAGDHRAIDGSIGAKLLRDMKSFLEDPAATLKP